ncbi:ABC transporter substrate-binding protein [Streptomyces mayteni]
MPTTGINRRAALRLLGLGAAASVGTGALTSCVPSGGVTTGGGDTAARNFQFTSWSLNEEAASATVERIVRAWETDHGATVDAVSYPYNDYLAQLTLKLRGGQVSGAVQLDVAWLGAVAPMGRLLDVSAAAARGGYTDVALASGRLDGVQYGLPWTTGSIGLIGNAALLEEAGVAEPPSTIAQFEDALRAVKELDGVVPYAAATKVAQLKDVFPWMRTFGCPLVADGAVAIGDDASIDAITWYKSLYDEGLIAPDVDRFDARALFSQGRVAFYDDAVVGKGATAAQAPDPALADAMVPLARPVLTAGDTPQALLWGHVIVIAEGDGSDSATEFALHATTDPATTAEVFERLALPPSTERGLADPVVADDTFTVEWTERITGTATAGPFWHSPRNAQIEEAVARRVQAVLVGQSSARDAMRAAGDEAASLLDA